MLFPKIENNAYFTFRGMCFQRLLSYPRVSQTAAFLTVLFLKVEHSALPSFFSTSVFKHTDSETWWSLRMMSSPQCAVTDLSIQPSNYTSMHVFFNITNFAIQHGNWMMYSTPSFFRVEQTAGILGFRVCILTLQTYWKMMLVEEWIQRVPQVFLHRVRYMTTILDFQDCVFWHYKVSETKW